MSKTKRGSDQAAGHPRLMNRIATRFVSQPPQDAPCPG